MSKSCSFTLCKGEKMEAEPLKVQVNLFPPYTNRCADRYPGSCLVPGYDPEFVYRILAAMGYSPRLEFLGNPDNIYGTPFDPKKFNITGYLSSSSTVNRSDVTLTAPLAIDSLVYLLPDSVFRFMPKNILTSTCSVGVYTALVLSFCFVYGFRKLYSKFWNGKFSNNGSSLVEISWWMLFTVFLGSFGSILTINVFRPAKPELPFRTVKELSELLRSKTCRAVIGPDTASKSVLNPPQNQNGENLDIVKMLSDDTKANLRIAYKLNPPLVRPSTAKFASALLSSKTCRIGITYATIASSYHFKKFESYLTTVHVKEGAGIPLRLMVQANSGLKEKIEEFVAAGFPDDTWHHIIKQQEETKHILANSRKNASPTTPNYLRKTRALDLVDLAQSMFALLVLLGIAVSGFLVELVWAKVYTVYSSMQTSIN